VESMRTLTNVAAKRGGSITIPCFYDKQYKTNSKYWCKGTYWSSCNVLAFANSSGIISVTDHPEQNILIVEMKPVFDSGYYWCAAEIGSSLDDRDHLYLRVSEDPGLSVVKSRVSGAEGGSVTVQCLYSAAYRNTQKYWCRFKDRSCKTVGKTDTSQNSAVHISNNGRSFSVEIRGLKKSDAGWYWCSAGDLEVPVHISVTDPPPVTKVLTTTVSKTVATTGTTTTHHVDSYTSVLKHQSAARLTAASSSVKSIPVSKHVSASPVTEESNTEKTSSSVK
ncbi:CMRF35-like molecule 1, partial [Clarias magur]